MKLIDRLFGRKAAQLTYDQVASLIDGVGGGVVAGVAVTDKTALQVATVLACEPDILVLDEPSANLDPVARRELAETLSVLNATMLIVTHDLPYAAQLCDRCLVMDSGRIVADGPTDVILRDEALLASHRLELPYGFTLPDKP